MKKTARSRKLEGSDTSAPWHGIEEMFERISIQMRIARDLVDMMHMRAKLEEEYSQRMTALVKQLSYAKTETAVQPAIEAVVFATDSAAKVHTEEANRFLNEIVQPFSFFLRNKEAERNRLFKEYSMKKKGPQQHGDDGQESSE